MIESVLDFKEMACDIIIMISVNRKQYFKETVL